MCRVQFVGYPGGPDLGGSSAEVVEDSTQVLDTSGLTIESLWSGYRRSRRQDIRKIRERGVTVEETRDAADIDEVHACYLETMKATGGMARYKRELLHAIVEHVTPQSGRMYVARHQGKVIAGMVVVDSARLSHGLLLAARSSARPQQPNKLLLHTAAERAITDGKDGLDFMPSGQSAQGVSKFKNLWGATTRPLQHHTFVVLPLRNWLWKTAYAMAGRPPFRAMLSYLRGSR